MDLYLMSPVFLRKMLQRLSTATPSVGGGEETKEPEVNDILQVVEESDSDSESEVEAREAYTRGGRRRSSLDRMLRQHAYIIICAFCYAYSLQEQGS